MALKLGSIYSYPITDKVKSQEYFSTTVGVHQGCLLSPTLSNISLEHIMSEAVIESISLVKLWRREISSIHFTDGIDLISGSTIE